MDKIIINGGKRLEGTIKISGSKNAALPILMATLLTDKLCSLTCVPYLYDVKTIISLLTHLGKTIKREDDRVRVSSSGNICLEAPYDLVCKMRASVLVMGPLLARYGKVKVSLPGGCAIGSRPINLHLDGFKKLGAEISIRKGFIHLSAKRGLKGRKIFLDFPSVGATENLMMAAVLAKGTTFLENVACEPEIIDLASFLNKMGAKIFNAGRNIIEIHGVEELNGVEHLVIPDRIETGTYLLAAALTRGRIKILNVNPTHLEIVIAKMKESGVEIKFDDSTMEVSASENLKPVDINTSPYPGFPTDMQAQWMAFMSVIPGESIISETVFENRFMHVAELQRMGANIRVKGDLAVINGVDKLSGVPVRATDLRASAALVLAGLIAEGETSISNIFHLDRGYESMEKKLGQLGAEIRREGDKDS
ncbi:UDP-N-acetylglucosamine 1-carboxyvinyltransferase [bacterium]|nr:UDP-N-acetylglucosamine 1-carboxyvinyltransferase [bacterium]